MSLAQIILNSSGRPSFGGRESFGDYGEKEEI